MLTPSITISKSDLCPKCGKLCSTWRVVQQHFWPKQKGRNSDLKDMGLVHGTPEYSSEAYRRRILKMNRPCRACGSQREVGQQKYCLGCRDTALSATWKAQHKAAKNRRKARLRGNGGSFTGTEFRELCEKFGNQCLSCGVVGVDLTVDHVLPLSKGGRNEISNIQPLCHACNVKKGDQMIDYRILRVA
jgi:5-methylcytosine-specific restriction endonuclease McrA